MISVCMLGGAGGSTASVTRYYLTPDHACGLGYYTEHDQVPGQWRGAGAAALGLTGDLQADGAARLGQLLNAQSPDGELLARPVWRADPAGRLPLAPLVEALQHLADARGVPVHEVVANPVDRGALLVILQRSEQRTPTPDLGALPGPDESPAGLATATARLATPLATRLPTGIPTGTAAVLHGVTVDAALAGRLATGADLDPVQVFRSPDGTDRFTPALAKAGAKVDIRRVGIDVTVSAPKSVSVLHGLADPNTAALIELCHDRAITQALGYLQRHAGHGLRGHHGDGQQMHHVATDGWIAASFARYTSRAGDPQLHTHLVIPNLLHGQDGTWSAIDSRAVFRNAKTAGFLYQAALRHELTRELHVTWTPPVKGLAEICGVPREVLREFSQRRQQIEAALRHTGRRGRAAQDACLATRQPKQRTSLAALRESWQQRAEALGASPEGLLTAARITHPPRDRASWQQRLNRLLRAEQPAPARDLLLSPEQIAHVAALVLGPDGVTAKTTGFDRRDLLQVLAVTVPVEHTGNALDLEHLADHLLRQPGPVPVHPGAEEEPRWTTLELLATEQRALALAASPNRTKVAEPEVVAQLLEGRGWLSPEQQSVIGQIAGDTRLATVLVGPAGSGKTAVLATIAALANQSEQPIVGCALAALTAARLQHDSAIPSTSLASLLARLQPAQGPRNPLAPGTWVVVDEAGMVGARQLTQLLEQVDHVGGRLLLVGDPAQLPEIDAGGMFRHLSHAEQRPSVLTGNQRQRHPWEAAALDRLRAGQHVAALVAYARNQRITPVSSRQDLHTQVAADYLTATAGATTPQQTRQTVVLASQHEDVDALNHQIRCALQQSGRLGPDTITLELPDGPVGFAPGDQVIITKPCRDSAGRKVLNGTRGQLLAADPAGLRVQPEEGPAFALRTDAAPDCLRHGYALTVHKAQGLTASTALVVAEGLTRNAAYTALSRGRDRNQLYACGEETPTGRPDWLSAWRRLCAQLERPTGDTLASAQLLTASPPPTRTAPTATPYSQAEHQDPTPGR